MKLEEFNNKYEYVTDKRKFGKTDVWEVMAPNKDNGMYYGDCESYMLTLKELVPEFKDIDLYFCYINTPPGGHCVGIDKNNKVIDCNAKRLMDFDAYTKRYTMIGLKKMSSFLIWYKTNKAKGIKALDTFKRINKYKTTLYSKLVNIFVFPIISIITFVINFIKNIIPKNK